MTNRRVFPTFAALIVAFCFLMIAAYPAEVFGQEVRGTVTDAQTGDPIPGVNVVVQGTTTGTTTDVDGEYELAVPSDDVVLVFSFVGYVTQEIPVEGRSEIDVVLEEGVDQLQELVVVGYGTQQRSDLTGSVSSVARQDIIQQPVYSVENVLQGQSAGVEVMADSYRPGEGSTIRIRGTRSFVASNDPLIVVDGVPIDGGLMDLNPRDVESIEILKDASATAIYGSRGANGVVLVTTRRGRDGLNVEYSGFTGVQYATNRLDVMDTQTYAEFRRDAARIGGYYTGNDADIFDPWEVEAIEEGRTTDWQDLVFGRGMQQNHTLSVRGGSDGTSYAISGSFDDHVAVVTNNDFRRYSGRINLDQQISSWLRAGLSSSLSNSLQHQSVNFTRVVTSAPHSSPFDDEGNITMFNEVGDRNPLFDMQRENNLDQRNRTRFLSTLYAEVDVWENLMLRANIAPDFTFRNDGFYSRDLTSQAGTRNDRETSILYEAILDYNTTFYDVHRINLTSLYSIQNSSRSITRLEGSDLPYEHQLFHNLGSAETVDHRSTSLSEWALESYMLRANYVYDDRYLVTLTGRLDGSSRLAEGNKYGLFPSFAVAWNVDQESFMDDVDFLSEFKLRFSAGEVGNTAIQPYQTQGTLASLVFAFGEQSVMAFQHDDIPNPDLKWERTRSMDLGLDFGLFQHRISGSIDVYESNTTDLLLLRQLPITSGYSSILENVGATRNRGIELSLSTWNFDSPGGFQWSTDLNISANRNEIVELYGGQEDDPGSGWFIGEPINAHYDFEFIGIWQEHEAEEAATYGAIPGDLKFRDVNGDGSIDRTILGSPDPKWSGGMTNRFSYQGIDFSFFVYTAQGMISQAGFGSAGPSGLLNFRTAPPRNLLNVNYWMPDRPSNQYPRPRDEAQVYRDALAYMNTSFVRVRNITLGYTLPTNLLQRLGAQSARVYTSVQNPFTFTPFQGYDPEGATGYDMPNYRTFLVGIDLTF